jgi:RpiB/LacA/LacB family sugar-phosphate isomerase
MKLSIGNDHAGYDLATFLIRWLAESSVGIFYYGTFSRGEPVDFSDYAKCVAEDVALKKSRFGILVCQSGIDMSIAANKIRGIRATNCLSGKIARLSRERNNANVLCLGSGFLKTKEAKNIVKTFLETQFLGGPYERQVEKMMALENSRYQTEFAARMQSVLSTSPNLNPIKTPRPPMELAP